MTYPLHRQFIAAVTAAAIAITGFSAAPARAGEDDLGKALAALAGLAVLGVVIKNARDDDKKARHPRTDRDYRQDGWTGWDDHNGRYGRDDRRGVKPKPLPRRVNRKLLPQECMRSIQVRDGRVRMFGQRCLERNYNAVNSLPRQCATRVQTDRGLRRGYGVSCLRRHGYQLARH